MCMLFIGSLVQTTAHIIKHFANKIPKILHLIILVIIKLLI